MRAILVMAAALAVLTVSGCDINSAPPKATQVQCNCGTTPPPVAAATPAPDMRGSTAYAPPARHHRYRHPRGFARWHDRSYFWRREYAELSVVTYDYHSGSQTYYDDGTGHHDTADNSGTHDDGYTRVDSGWIDGYGRGHGNGGAHGGSGDDARGRLHVWHGYDADCPDQHRR
jgi:hypothetical protein